jgi:hypothetical protein
MKCTFPPVHILLVLVLEYQCIPVITPYRAWTTYTGARTEHSSTTVVLPVQYLVQARRRAISHSITLLVVVPVLVRL